MEKLRKIDIEAARTRANELRNFSPPERLRKNVAFRLMRAIQLSRYPEEDRYPTMSEVAAVIKEKYGVNFGVSAVNDMIRIVRSGGEEERLADLADRVRAGILITKIEQGKRIHNPKKALLINFFQKGSEIGFTQASAELPLPFRNAAQGLARLAKADLFFDPNLSRAVTGGIQNAYEQVFTEIQRRLDEPGRIRSRTGSRPLEERLIDWEAELEKGHFPNLGTYWEAFLTTELIPVFDQVFSSDHLSWFDRFVFDDLRQGKSVSQSVSRINQQITGADRGYIIELQPQEIALARAMLLRD